MYLGQAQQAVDSTYRKFSEMKFVPFCSKKSFYTDEKKRKEQEHDS